MLRKVLFAGGVVTVAILALGTPASATPQERFTICHAAGLASGPANWVTLEDLPASAVFGNEHGGGHFNENGTTKAGHEQDYFGACTVVVPPTDPPVDPPPTTPPTTPEPPVTPPVAPEQPTVVVGEPTAPIVAPPATEVPIATGELAYTGASDWLPLAIAFALGAIVIGVILNRNYGGRKTVEPEHHLSQR